MNFIIIKIQKFNQKVYKLKSLFFKTFFYNFLALRSLQKKTCKSPRFNKGSRE